MSIFYAKHSSCHIVDIDGWFEDKKEEREKGKEKKEQRKKEHFLLLKRNSSKSLRRGREKAKFLSAGITHTEKDWVN